MFGKDKKDKKDVHILFSESMSDEEIKDYIPEDMINLKNQEAGTGWMRMGTLFSMNSGEQLMGQAFKAIIDQNKLIIRQNELLYRELKKLNQHFENESE